MASRNLEDLHPALEPLAKEFLLQCQAHGLDILITCTYRSNEEQDALYAQGRTKPGKIVTDARGGQSEHNFTLNGKPAAKAFDIVPIVNGKPVWNEKDPVWYKIEQVWDQGFRNGNYYLDWYGKPGAEFHEKFHFCLKEIVS